MEYKGKLKKGDFKDNTMTFEIEGEMTLQSGIYKIVQIQEEPHTLNTPIIRDLMPTMDDVVAEGNRQIKEWMQDKHYKEHMSYRIAFMRSYAYVLECVKRARTSVANSKI